MWRPWLSERCDLVLNAMRYKHSTKMDRSAAKLFMSISRWRTETGAYMQRIQEGYFISSSRARDNRLDQEPPLVQRIPSASVVTLQMRATSKITLMNGFNRIKT